MEIINNKIVAIQTDDPTEILTVIPKSKQIGPHEVAVSWGLEEMQILKNIGIKNVKSPIEGTYNWRAKPYAHQITTSGFLTLNKRSFCFSSPGVGKTASVIWAADYLMNKGLVSRALIVCPLSIMESAWVNDLFKFAMHRTCNVLHGSKEKRLKVLNSQADFDIINFDGVKTMVNELAKMKYDLIVIDEANAIKHTNTDRWKALNKVCQPAPWVWAMTGTPASQSPVDAYGLAKLVVPSNVPKSISTFRDLVMHRVTQFKWVPKPNNKAIVYEALQPAIRFTKEECLDLPDLTYTSRHADLSAQQEKHYKLLRDQMLLEVAGETITAVNAAVNINKLLQISCGCVYSDDSETVAFDIGPRYNILKEVLDECERKVLIFAPYRHIIGRLNELLTEDGYTNEVIHGGVTAGSRTDIFNRFQNADDPRVLIIQPQAAAHGLTLHRADTTVWWGPIASYETYAQANARTHRMGQKNPCLVVQLEGSPIERRLYKLLDDKREMQDNLVALYKQLID